MQVTGSSSFSSYGFRIGAAEGYGSSDGVEYAYALSTHQWYGVYEVAVFIRAVRILISVSVAVANTPLHLREGKGDILEQLCRRWRKMVSAATD